MRIGYIILCHKDPDLVAAIANKVTRGTDNIAVIHVDLKTDIEPFINGIDNEQIIILENRKPIYWGGFSAIDATIGALKKALEFDCNRYILLQGCDYPLHTNAYIDEFFDRNKDVEFLKAYNITKSTRAFNYMKSWGLHIYDGVDRHNKNIKTLFARGLEAINKFGLKYRRGYYYDKATDSKYDIFWGWGHFALTKKCVEYILDVYKNNTGLNKYFKYTFPADETYFQTIVYNSPFIKSTVDGKAVNEDDHLTNESMLNLTYFEYPEKVVEFQDPREVPEKVFEKYLYIRKITMDYIQKTSEGVIK